MNPRPIIVATLCALPLLAVAALALKPGDAASRRASDATGLGAADGVPTAALAAAAPSGDGAEAAPTHGPLSGLPAHIADRALARAFAAVGAASLGDEHALNQLDAAARERVDEARVLLAAQPLVSRGRAAAGSEAATGATNGARQPGAAAPAPGAEATAGLVLDLAHAVDPHEALRSTPAGPVLIEPGLWAKAAFDPSAQRQLVVSDACGGGYAIAVFAGDFSTVRVDGGLVVPGRYYLVDGSSVITGAVPCTVDIRPLSALETYAPRPARPPQSNG